MANTRSLIRESKNRFVTWSVALAALTGFTALSRAAVIADWTFETTPSATAKTGVTGAFTGNATSIFADSGDEAASASAVASAFHTGASGYTNVAGNGSTNSFSSNNWAVNDYYEFDIDSTNYTGITLTFDQTGSATGPKAFKIQYNNGSGWTDLAAGSYNVANTTTTSGNATSIGWTPTTSNAASAVSFDLSAISGLTGIRIVDNGTVSLGTSSTVGTGGTIRLDNVTFSGTSTVAAPEPASAAALAGGAAFLLGRRRNRK